MKTLMKGLAVMTLAAACATGAQAATSPDAALRAQTQAFIEAYAKVDRDAVFKSVHPNKIYIYGSDASEFISDHAGLKAMLDADAKLWGGTAAFGKMDHVSITRSGDMASIFFDAPFTVGGRPAVPVRFAMVWRKVGGRWLLVQSSNVVPTVGSSATEILAKH